MNLYWNWCTEGVETKSSSQNCPIIRGIDDGVVIESWCVDKERNLVINYAHTRDFLDRRSFFLNNNIDPDDNNLELRWLVLPKNEYDELIEQYCKTGDNMECKDEDGLTIKERTINDVFKYGLTGCFDCKEDK